MSERKTEELLFRGRSQTIDEIIMAVDTEFTAIMDVHVQPEGEAAQALVEGLYKRKLDQLMHKRGPELAPSSFEDRAIEELDPQALATDPTVLAWHRFFDLAGMSFVLKQADPLIYMTPAILNWQHRKGETALHAPEWAPKALETFIKRLINVGLVQHPQALAFLPEGEHTCARYVAAVRAFPQAAAYFIKGPDLADAVLAALNAAPDCYKYMPRMVITEQVAVRAIELHSQGHRDDLLDEIPWVPTWTPAIIHALYVCYIINTQYGEDKNHQILQRFEKDVIGELWGRLEHQRVEEVRQLLLDAEQVWDVVVCEDKDAFDTVVPNKDYNLVLRGTDALYSGRLFGPEGVSLQRCSPLVLTSKRNRDREMRIYPREKTMGWYDEAPILSGRCKEIDIYKAFYTDGISAQEKIAAFSMSVEYGSGSDSFDEFCRQNSLAHCIAMCAPVFGTKKLCQFTRPFSLLTGLSKRQAMNMIDEEKGKGWASHRSFVSEERDEGLCELVVLDIPPFDKEHKGADGRFPGRFFAMLKMPSGGYARFQAWFSMTGYGDEDEEFPWIVLWDWKRRLTLFAIVWATYMTGQRRTNCKGCGNSLKFMGPLNIGLGHPRHPEDTPPPFQYGTAFDSYLDEEIPTTAETWLLYSACIFSTGLCGGTDEERAEILNKAAQIWRIIKRHE